MLLTLVALVPCAIAQRTVAIKGDRLSGFVLPIEPLRTDIRLQALRCWSWTVDDTQRLYLEGDVVILIDGYSYDTQRAVVWINRVPSAEGLINQIAVYFDEVSNPTRSAGVGAEGKDLLVTGSTRGSVILNVALRQTGTPRFKAILPQAEARLADYLKRLLVPPPPPLEDRPQFERPTPPQSFIPVPGGQVTPQELQLPADVTLPAQESATVPLFAPRGVVRWSAGQVDFVPGAEENTIVATGSLVVEYLSTDPTEEWTQITLSGQRGVIFAAPGSVESMLQQQLSAESVYGIYLEGNVTVSAQDGDYVVRAPRVYYDLRTNSAVLVNAVLRTYARAIGLPIYARAEELRQVALNQWTGKKVLVSTSEFHSPHVALGADRMTLTRRPARADPEERETYLVSEDNRLLVGNIPVAIWPHFQGTVRQIPLKQLGIGSQTNKGIVFESRWDLLSLLGTDGPDGVDVDVQLLAATKRGAGGGFDVDYDRGPLQGGLTLFGMYDDGTDKTSAGVEVEPSTKWRGEALWEQQLQLSPEWSLQTQTSWISDATFVSSWREEDYEERREYETSGFLIQQKDNTALSVLAKYALNDFISNDYLLASRQYQVVKMPELAYRRYGDSLFGDKVSYSGQTRLDYMRLILESGTPNQIGVPGVAFGIPNNADISTELRARGYQSSWLGRFDTFHEFSRPFSWAGVHFDPFISGRLTAWSENIDRSPIESQSPTRWYGAAGVRVNTQFSHIDNTASNELLDINRLRHIIEPSVTAWYGLSSIDNEKLAVYDQRVEPLTTGAAVKLGLRNTLQTERGGPGRWRSVDLLTLDVSAVFSGQDADIQTSVPQFFDFQPAYSQSGDHIFASLSWLVSDSVSLLGQITYDLDDSVNARSSIGVELQHSPVLTTFIEYRYVEAGNNEVLGILWRYKLTPKYRFDFRPQWDFVENKFRDISLGITRSFPDFDLLLQIRRDNIRGDTTVGASIGFVEF